MQQVHGRRGGGGCLRCLAIGRQRSGPKRRRKAGEADCARRPSRSRVSHRDLLPCGIRVRCGDYIKTPYPGRTQTPCWTVRVDRSVSPVLTAINLDTQNGSSAGQERVPPQHTVYPQTANYTVERGTPPRPNHWLIEGGGPPLSDSSPINLIPRRGLSLDRLGLTCAKRRRRSSPRGSPCTEP